MGDGSYLMLHTALVTAMQEGVKIIVVVFDNLGFQCIDNLQASQGIVKFGNELRIRDAATGRLTGAPLVIDFAKNAESYGLCGYAPKSMEEFRSAVRAALAASVSSVIDVKVTPKSMTGGYDSWWRVGTAEVSQTPAVAEASRLMREQAARARRY